MTDPRTPAASKPMWTRHKPGCGQRIFNDPIDIDNHRRYCPAAFEKTLKEFGEKLTAIEKTVGSVSEQVEAGPAIDPDEIAPWDDSDDQSDDDTGGAVTTESDVQAIPIGQYYADPIDDEDEADYGSASRQAG